MIGEGILWEGSILFHMSQKVVSLKSKSKRNEYEQEKEENK